MASNKLLDPVTANDVPQIDNAVAVGEDLKFQERWWTFERVAWNIFLLILLADVLGAFGNGWLAKAKKQEAGSGMLVKYDRIERTFTPSRVTLQFGPDAASNGKIILFVRNNLLKDLGASRVIPQPELSTVGSDGVTYTFSAAKGESEVAFELEPASPGVRWIYMQVQGHTPVNARVVVMP
ncbi:MAG: hypothetical protein ACRYGF_01895 [Janthinobacterium lividum]